MGADMLIGALAVRADEKPDFEAGRQFVTKLSDERVIEITQPLVDSGTIWDGDEDYFDENNQPEVGAFRTWLLDQISDLEETLGSRYCSALRVRDLTLFIAGGLSWGDAPEGCDAMWALENIPDLLAAMNFVPDYWDVDKPVTPEEEQAAVQSIVGSQ